MNNLSNYKIIIRAQTADEEFDYLMKVFEKMTFYNKYGYKIPIPDHPFFINISNNLDLLKSLNMEEARNIFKADVYDLDYFKNGLEVINKDINLIEKAIEKMEKWKIWGFKLFSKYEIKLTAYGPGGSYDTNKGGVVMKTNLRGDVKHTPIHIIVHEIVHIGIEESIVKKFKLTHIEKEELVDAICANYFDDILIDYNVQKLGDKKVFKLISKNNIMELPQLIAEYKKE